MAQFPTDKTERPLSEEERERTLLLSAPDHTALRQFTSRLDSFNEGDIDGTMANDFMMMASSIIQSKHYAARVSNIHTDYAVMHKDRKYTMGSQTLAKASSENAGTQLRQQMTGTGVYTQWLPASMIWITMKKPSTDEVAELHHTLINKKAEYGRSTNGIVLSATEALLITDCLDFCLSYVVKATVEFKTIDNLKSIIRASDYGVILHMMNCLLFSKPYPYSIRCLAEPKEDGTYCDHEETGEVALKHLFHYDWDAYTETELDFLTDRSSTHPKATIEKVQFGIRPDEVAKPVKFNRAMRYKVYETELGSLHVTLSNPTLKRYLAESERWINRMTTISTKMGKYATNVERSAYMSEQFTLSELLQQSFLIDDFEWCDVDGNVVTKYSNREQITSVLREFNTETEFADALRGSYDDCIGEITGCWIGTLTEACNSCGNLPAGVTQEMTDHVTPFPVSTLFFTMVGFAQLSNMENLRKSLSDS